MSDNMNTTFLTRISNALPIQQPGTETERTRAETQLSQITSLAIVCLKRLNINRSMRVITNNIM